jgi:LEA14-like dessication related protein
MNRARLLLFTSIAASGGCAELEEFTPKVRFETLEVRDISFERADVDFLFSIENPNPIDLGLSSFSYDLGFEGIPLFSGSNADGLQLEAVGQSELRLPVGFTWQEAWQTVQATRGEDIVEFGLGGDFGFETPIGEVLVPYDAGGDFPAVRTPQVAFRKLRVTGVDLGGNANLKLDLDVDNDHGSSLSFQNFDYTVSLGGRQVGRGLIRRFGSVDGATTGTMTVPLEVSLLDVGSQVWDALNGGNRLRVRLAATTDVDTPFGVLPLAVDEDGDVTVERE